MVDAADVKGVVFKNASVILLARVVGADGSAITQATLSSAKYTIYELDDEWPDNRTAVAGHTNVALTIADLIYDTLQTGDLWDADATGYNFLHEIDTSTNEAFATAGKTYLVDFELTPASGQEIHVRFRLECI
jgi:hypothetical protein